VRQWKEKHGLNFYFNPPKSPDLSIIENCWQPIKQYVDSQPYWDEDKVKEAIIKGWRTKVSQNFINRLVERYPQRLKDIIESKGKMLGH
jgi:transposase